MLVWLLPMFTSNSQAAPNSANNARLQQALAAYPEADVDGDGVLTLDEARAYQKEMKDRQNAKQGNDVRIEIAPPPTHENVRYGKYERNVLDLWLPESDTPSPLIVFIHGGGFIGGDKEKIHTSPLVQMALDHGVAFASIQYRFRYPDDTDEFTDPERAGIQDILRDSARAIQFLRYKAEAYHLDKRVIAYGSSAGAGTSLWLAVHDDLADPKSDDPVLRESSRLTAAGMLAGQFTYDITLWDQYFEGGDILKTHGDGSGLAHFNRFYALDPETYAGPIGAKWRADVDMFGLLSADDPPIFAHTNNPNVPPDTRGIYNHHPHHALLIEERCKEKGVEVLCLVPKVRPEDATRLEATSDGKVMMEFFFEKLGKKESQELAVAQRNSH